MIKHWHWIVAVSLFSLVPLPAQRVLFGDLESYLYDYVVSLPVAGSNVYRDPEPEDQANLSTAVKLLVVGDLAGAQAISGNSGYEVIRYIDNTGTTNREFWGLQPQPGGTHYWGVLFWNPVSCRNVVLQSPHPRFDSNTGRQGLIYCFTWMSGADDQRHPSLQQYSAQRMFRNDYSVWQQCTVPPV